MDRQEMSERVAQGLPVYGDSDQPEWVRGTAYRNSAFSQLKFGELDVTISSHLLLTSVYSCISDVSFLPAFASFFVCSFSFSGSIL